MDSDQIPVLDHGYVQLVESWGSDERIIEAARMSTGKGFIGWEPRCKECSSTDVRPGYEPPYTGLGDDPVGYPPWCNVCNKKIALVSDANLLKTLYTNKHMTPFEMAGAVFEIKAPIMVYREWHRHRTQSYNEMSARYTPLPDESYVPTVDRMLVNSKTNKQAGTIKDADELTPEMAQELREEEIAFNVVAERFYQKKLKAGVPKELARTHIGVSRYSRMRASANLRNWMGFLTLRDEEHAQWEIRQYAGKVRDALKVIFPRTMQLFTEGQR